MHKKKSIIQSLNKDISLMQNPSRWWKINWKEISKEIILILQQQMAKYMWSFLWGLMWVLKSLWFSCLRSWLSPSFCLKISKIIAMYRKIVQLCLLYRKLRRNYIFFLSCLALNTFTVLWAGSRAGILFDFLWGCDGVVIRKAEGIVGDRRKGF